MTLTRLGRALWFAFAAVLLTPATAAQVNPCDPQLIQPSANPYGYRLRGDRCEGIYVQQVGGTPLAVVSWTESFEDYDLTSSRPLIIEWDSPARARVRLAAHALRRRLYYRMDAIRPAGSGSYSWTPDLLSSIGIGRDELGIVGSVQGPAGNSGRDLYLPLRIAQKGKPMRTGSYKLLLMAGVELQELYLTITSKEPGRHTPLKNGERLGYGYYPAGRAVEIPIQAPAASGIYYVEIGAMLRSGAVSTAEFWFYHPRK